jgi:ubiquinone/menaquinone biosynthesis C-methylase UbiE
MEGIPSGLDKQDSADSEVEARAEYILGRLGFSWEALEGKRILDIGAGSAEFGAAARKRGVEIVSLDPKPLDDRDEPIFQKEGYVQGDAKHLPFADESFDVVVSHASVPLHAAVDKVAVQHFLEEIRRVLKKGGECRFGPVGVGGALFPADESNRFPDIEGMTSDDVEKAIQETSLKTTALLRELIPDLKNSTDDPFAQTKNFYSFTKENK